MGALCTCIGGIVKSRWKHPSTREREKTGFKDFSSDRNKNRKWCHSNQQTDKSILMSETNDTYRMYYVRQFFELLDKIWFWGPSISLSLSLFLSLFFFFYLPKSKNTICYRGCMKTDINRKSPLFNLSVSVCLSQSKGKQIISSLRLYFDKTIIIFRKFPQEGEILNN